MAITNYAVFVGALLADLRRLIADEPRNINAVGNEEVEAYLRRAINWVQRARDDLVPLSSAVQNAEQQLFIESTVRRLHVTGWQWRTPLEGQTARKMLDRTREDLRECDAALTRLVDSLPRTSPRPEISAPSQVLITHAGSGTQNKQSKYGPAMSACALVKDISSELADWLRKQPSVGEESLTDWLLHRMSATVPWIRYLKFTRHEEGTSSGADWEWWLLGDLISLGIRIQAKRLDGLGDAYPHLAYANRYGLQVEMLLESANQQNLLPLYAVYHQHYGTAPSLCPNTASHSASLANGALLADAETWYQRYIKPGRSKLPPAALLPESCPLTCLFCCGMPSDTSPNRINDLVSYIQRTLRGTVPDQSLPGVYDEPPDHVTAVLGADADEPPIWIQEKYADRLRGVNALLVFDMRRQEEERER